MMFTTNLAVFTCFTVVIVSGSYNFMNCHGNRVVLEVLRRCCDSDELPNNCECFDISGKSDFTNSLMQLPLCPKDLEASFQLYTKINRCGTTIKVGEISSLFDGSKATKIIIHGFRSKAPKYWSLDMMNTLLTMADVNVILVDWEKGAAAPNYYLCAANTRSVGAMVARLIQELHITKGASYQSFHLIGHSLGAHVSGIAGREIQRLTSHSLGRISGLDPASPLFEDESPNVRLDKRDASFVDVIHTNADPLHLAGFGIQRNIGHVDFYPNGGKLQPGCAVDVSPSTKVEDIIKHIGCSHVRVNQLYLDTMFQCTPKPVGCPMGYHANTTCRGVFLPTTESVQPFCVK